MCTIIPQHIIQARKTSTGTRGDWANQDKLEHQQPTDAQGGHRFCWTSKAEGDTAEPNEGQPKEETDQDRDETTILITICQKTRRGSVHSATNCVNLPYHQVVEGIVFDIRLIGQTIAEDVVITTHKTDCLDHAAVLAAQAASQTASECPPPQQ